MHVLREVFRSRGLPVAALTFVALLLLGPPAEAGPGGVDAIPLEGVKVRIDGILSEWRGARNTLGLLVRGDRADGDPDVYALFGFDKKHLYLAFKVVDASLVRSTVPAASDDHGVVELAFPKAGGGFSVRELELYPGKPGKLPAVLKSGGKVLKGVEIVEAPMPGGYKIEAKVPWALLPEAEKARVGLRAGFRFVDGDKGKSGTVVMASTNSTTPNGWPRLRFESERSLHENLIREQGLPDEPARVVYGNVAGDDMFEQVAVYGTFMTILGPRYRGGNEFYYGELGVPSSKSIEKLMLADFDADGRSEIIVQKRIGSRERYREIIEVFTVEHDGTPNPMFRHEVAIKTQAGLIQNRVTIQRGAAATLTIAQDKVTGISSDEYQEPLAGGMSSALLPWDRVKSRTFKWRRDELGMWSEERWKPKMAPPSGSGPRPSSPAPRASGMPSSTRAESPSSSKPEPAGPRPPTAAENLERVYALYRRDRGVAKTKSRFDFVADIAEDDSVERVLVHGKDIVAFGKGFLNGQSYSMISVGVADAKDIRDVGARDITGDGKAEILVRGVLYAKASRALGGDTVTRHALFVYAVESGRLVRLFAAEIARELGKKKIAGDYSFEATSSGRFIDLKRGRAVGWTEENYPFPEDTTTAGGLEPLLLPWSEAVRRRYRFTGGRFELE